eukprot:scaffold529_cov308-Pinguiococcus_pyrenoidosus.AAC.23
MKRFLVRVWRHEGVQKLGYPHPHQSDANTPDFAILLLEQREGCGEDLVLGRHPFSRHGRPRANMKVTRLQLEGDVPPAKALLVHGLPQRRADAAQRLTQFVKAILCLERPLAADPFPIHHLPRHSVERVSAVRETLPEPLALLFLGPQPQAHSE